jgi:hypothetical protein
MIFDKGRKNKYLVSFSLEWGINNPLFIAVSSFGESRCRMTSPLRQRLILTDQGTVTYS